MHNLIEPEDDKAAIRQQVRDLLSKLEASTLQPPLRYEGDPASDQVAEAFPGKVLRTVSVFSVIKRCGSPALRRAVDDQLIRPMHAYELCHLNHAGQDAFIALGRRAAQYAAREIAGIRREPRKEVPRA